VVWRTRVSLSTRRPVGESEFLTFLGLAVSVRADDLTVQVLGHRPIYRDARGSVGLCLCGERSVGR